MSTALHVLILEDRAADAELMVRELRRAGFEPYYQRVAAEADYLAHLDPPPDLILADYTLPQFAALRALDLLQQRGLDIPFIVVSGTVSEETAVECMKQGAADYVLKDKLTRLGQAAVHALEDKKTRDEKRLAQATLRAEHAFRTAIEDCMLAGVAAVDLDGRQTYVNPALCRMVGWSQQDLVGALPPFKYWPAEELDTILAQFRKAVAGEALYGVELVFQRSNGERFHALVLASPLVDSTGQRTGSLATVYNISQRKHAERQLQESEERYRALAEAAHDAIFIVGRGGHVLYANSFAASQLRVRPQDLLGKRLDELFPRATADLQTQSLEQVFRTGQPLYVERETPYPGRKVWLGTWLAPLRTETGQVSAVLGVARDITETKHAQRELEQSYAEADAMFRVSRAVASSIGLGSMATEALAAAMEVLHLDGGTLRYLDEATGDLVLLASLAMAHGAVQELSARPRLRSGEGTPSTVVRTGEPVVIPDAKRDPQVASLGLLGSEFQSYVGIPLKVQHEVVGTISGFCRTARSLTQRELDLATSVGNIVGMAIAKARLFDQVEARSQEWERTFDNMGDGIFILSLDYRIVRANRALATMLGTTPKALVGEHCYRAVHGLDAPLPECPSTLCLAEKGHCELVRQEPNLGNRWLEISAEPIMGAQGEVVSIIHTVKDITENRRAEEVLRASEARYRSLVEATGAWVTRVDRQRKRTLSVGSEAVFGDAIRRSASAEFGSQVVPEDREAFLATLQRVFDTGQPVYSGTHRALIEGRVRFLSDNWEPIKDGKGKVVEVQLTSVDVTEQKRLEEQYHQAQKMEPVGRLAGGVAHDFNNLLTAILGYAEMGQAAASPDSPLSAYFDEIRGAGERAGSLTNRLLAFSRRQTFQPKAFCLTDLVSNLANMLGRLIGEDVELVIRTPRDIWSVKADPGQVEQVLVNLAVNARDAMPLGGKLTIEVTNTSLDQHQASLTPGDYVGVAVTDTGTGMSDEVKEHLFEPFFTTKPQGTGLGLATCHGIVKQSGGHIFVYSEPGHGTTVRFLLPRTMEGAEQTLRPQPATLTTGKETVLLVEDDTAVRTLAATVLRSLGYTVLEASTGAEALRLLQGDAEQPVHLLLTDLVMPQMGGVELADKLRALRPTTRVLFMSGYAPEGVAHGGELESGARLLQKPFTPAILSQQVREVLDQ